MKLRHAFPPLLAAAVLPLAGCGIPSTGVVGAGEPATGVLRPGSTAVPEEAPSAAERAATIPVYFVRSGALEAVPRPAPVPAGPQSAVLLLLKGPDAEERAQGLATELPSALTTAPTLRTDGATVTVELPPAAGILTGTAVDQLACTAAAARLRQDPQLGAVQVTVEQPDGRLAGRSGDDCPDAADAVTGGQAVSPASP
ncbi:hypothetical protein GCM10010129_41980 [Streptomyces fumigatiscleroticus]|nr:hypothetical protein GCM10010129_41980 [Streptomyces fumigatiscleroticus]